MATLPEAARLLAIASCVHRWKLESPIGAVTHGLCSICGTPRDFFETEHEGGYWRRTPRVRANSR